MLFYYRLECDELRELESKALEKEVSFARGEQLKEMEVVRANEVELDKHYHALWEQDRLKYVLSFTTPSLYCKDN